MLYVRVVQVITELVVILFFFFFNEKTGQDRHATPILSLSHGVFTDQFIFRQVYNHYFPRKFKFRSA